MNRSAEVRLAGIRVGRLTEIGRDTAFQYDREWCERADAVPISLTLPVRREPFVAPGLHPFFENLLPEGWLLEISLASLKLTKDDAFGILLATCADCIGAVEILPESASSATPESGSP